MLARSSVHFAYFLKRNPFYKNTKRFFYNLLENPDSRMRSYFDLFMICLVMTSMFILVYSVEHTITDTGEWVERFVVTIFICEYILRGWLYSDTHQIILQEYEKADYLNIRFSFLKALKLILLSKIRYVFSFFAIIDLLAILPSYRPLRILRVLLIFRLFKLFRYSNSIKIFSDVLISKRFELITLAIFMGFLIFIASIAIYLFENESNGGKIGHLYEALYWSIVTISTVGYGDITPHTPAGRLITIILILSGLGVLSFFTSIIVSAFNDKMNTLLENRTLAELNRFKNYVIVCGFGRVGQEIAQQFEKDNQAFIIIDKDDEKILLAEQKQYLTIQADASVNSILINAGINRGATAIICATQSDVANVFITLTGRYLNPHINIISRASRHDTVKKLFQAGATHVIQPFEIAGLLAAEYVGQPVAFEAILGILNEQKNIRMDTIIVTPRSKLIHKKIGELGFENVKLKVIGVISSNLTHKNHRNRYKIVDQHFYFNPAKNFELQEKDIIVVLGRKYSIEYFQDQITQSSLGISS